MKRRSFVKQGCLACLGIAGSGLIMESCGTPLPLMKSEATNKTITVPADKFQAENKLLVVRTTAMEHDILLIKNADSYKALYMECTHEYTGLVPTAKRIYCPQHGSVFDFNGQVMKEPALTPLKQFKTTFENNNIIIYLT